MARKWQKHTYLIVFVLGVLLCLYSTLDGFATVEGQTPVWSDNFNDGTFAPEWTEIFGTFTVTNNRLNPSSGQYPWISHASTVAEGEWRFDFLATSGWNRVAFIALDTDTFGVYNFRPIDGYCLEFSLNDDVVQLHRHSGGNRIFMDSYSDTGLYNTLQQVTVTRDSAGVFSVFVNDDQKFQATSTHHSTSLYFLVMLQAAYIDNIEVYNQILTEWVDGNGGTPPPFPVLPAVALAIGLPIALILFVLYRRRR